MAYKDFCEELRRIVSMGDEKIAEVLPETSLEGVDSLGQTEICVIAEEHLGVAVDFSEVKACKTYGDLQDLLSSKGYGP